MTWMIEIVREELDLLFFFSFFLWIEEQNHLDLQCLYIYMILKVKSEDSVEFRIKKRGGRGENYRLSTCGLPQI